MFKDGVETLANADGTLSLDCGGSDNEASRIFELSTVRKIGFDLLAVSEGIVDVLVELEVSNSLTATEFAEQTGYTDIVNLLNTTRYRKTIVDASIPGFKYGRLKATGQNSNAAGNTLTGTLNLIREEE